MVKRWSNWCAVTHRHQMRQEADGLYVLASDYDALAARLAEALASEERTQRLWDEAEARLAEFQRLYRGQIANDGSYPDHLFGAADSADAAQEG